MNVEGIYQLQRDNAFATQFQSAEYETFVAMPFSNRGGYPEGRIRKLLAGVHERANSLLHNGSRRRFAPLRRIDEITSGTVTITDEIIRQVLSCHFFWGDVTGCNFGVVLETGLALALKPNERDYSTLRTAHIPCISISQSQGLHAIEKQISWSGWLETCCTQHRDLNRKQIGISGFCPASLRQTQLMCSIFMAACGKIGPLQPIDLRCFTASLRSTWTISLVQMGE